MELTEKKALINEWLKLFGDSTLFLLNKDINNVKGPDWSMMHTHEFSIETNHDVPYGLYFTPSGNFGRKNVPGKKLVRTAAEADDYVPALFFDLDLKIIPDPNVSSVDELFDEVMRIIKERQLPVNFLVKSGGGVHGYCMIEPTSRIMTGQELKRKFTKMLERLADFFPGSDHNCLTIEKLMRCPFSNHWKTGAPIEVELYRLRRGMDDDMNFEVTAHRVTTKEDMVLDEFDYMPYESVKSFADSVVEAVEMRKTNGLILESGANEDSVIVNKLPIHHVMERLSKYPRTRKMKWGDSEYDTATRFVCEGTNIGFEHVNMITGEVKTESTQGYRINSEENYVHNFTFTNHDIKERPRGPVYPFLFHYFDSDRTKIKEFLENEFHIKIFEKVADAVMPSILSSNGVIEFTKKRVTYRKEKMTPKGPIKVEVVLFDTPVIVKGVIESKYSLRGEVATPVKYYVLHRPDSFEHKDVVVEFKENRIKFNQSYGKYGLIFKGDESDLLDFYLAINNAVQAGQVERYDIAYLNGYHPEYFLMGNKFIDPEFRITDKWKNTIVETQPVELALEGKEQVELKEFGAALRALYSDRVSMNAFASYVALFLGTVYWKPLEKYKQQLMLPAVMFSGKTMAGKSTIISMLKEGSGMSPKARVKSVRSTTPQPLKQAATDAFVLHLEEFTGNSISTEKEAIIRDIINQARSARGTLSGDNIQYEYRASVILDGERMPSSRSVVNRCVVIPMFETDKLGTESAMREIRSKCFLKDLITKAYLVTDEIKEAAFLEAEEKLSGKFSGRQLMLYSFLLTANILFELFPEDELISAMTDNASSLSEVTDEGDELSTLLADLLVNRRIMAAKVNSFDDGYVCEVPIPPEILSEKQVELIAVLRKYPDSVKFSNNRLTIKAKGSDLAMMGRLSAFEQYMRNRF